MVNTVIDPSTVKEDRRRARMGSLAVTLTKTDRILTGRDDVTLAFYSGDSPSVDAPAWNDGKRITIHADKLPSIESASGLVTTLGLNHHEVAHILFSLGSHTPFIQTIVSRNHFEAYNLLEDMRIETLLSSQYVSMKKYLTAPVLHFIVEVEDAWPTAHLLTYGRRFLPLAIRKEFRKQFIGSASVRREAESIIDEFRMMDLSDTSKHNRAAELVKKFHELMEALSPSLNADQIEALNGHKGCKGVKEFTNDRAKVARAEKDAGRRQNAAEDEEDDGGDEDEDGNDWSGSMDDDSGDDESSDPSESSGGRGKGSPDEDEDEGASGSGDSSEEEEDDANEAGSQGGGPGSSGDGDDEDGEGDGLDVGGSPGGPSGSSAETVENMIQAAINEINEDSEVQDEITRLQSAMNDNTNLDAMIPQGKSRDKAPSAEAGSACAMVTREFQVLATPFEAGWEYGTDYGRINAQRAMSAEFGDTDIYDSWDEGREADAALEVVISLDASGSMGHAGMASACEAAWVVKRGIDEVDGKSVVMTFHSETYKLYGRQDRANPGAVRHVVDMGSSTEPADSMREARMILNESDRPNRLYVIITDGGFARGRYDYSLGQVVPYDHKGLLESMNATRVYIGIGTQSSAELKPCYDVHATISSASEIPAIIKKAVASMLNDAYKRR